MKLIKIFVLVSMLTVILPFGAFAHDSNHPDDTAQDGHCVMMCHAVCFHAIISAEKVVITHSLPATVPAPSHAILSYQSPFLDSFRRPPITIA